MSSLKGTYADSEVHFKNFARMTSWVNTTQSYFTRPLSLGN